MCGQVTINKELGAPGKKQSGRFVGLGAPGKESEKLW